MSYSKALPSFQGEMTQTQPGAFEAFGSDTPFAEPLWYRTGVSPYYDQVG